MPNVERAEVELPKGATAYSVELPSFEGPLDLLLHLIQKHELDILDIPIGFITEKYLEYLTMMELLDLDLASEYLLMAATLAHIKSKMLLPAPPPGQEDDASDGDEEDPREALIRRLLEYQKYKQAAHELQEKGLAAQSVFGRGAALEEAVETGEAPLAPVSLFTLMGAFQRVLDKNKVKLTHEIVHERLTLTDRINELVTLLAERKRLAFEEMFEKLETTFDLVITFLAILEMSKLRMTRLFQTDLESPIYVEYVGTLESAGADLITAQVVLGVEHQGEEPQPGPGEGGARASLTDATVSAMLADEDEDDGEFDAAAFMAELDGGAEAARSRPSAPLDERAPDGGEGSLSAAPSAEVLEIEATGEPADATEHEGALAGNDGHDAHGDDELELADLAVPADDDESLSDPFDAGAAPEGAPAPSASDDEEVQ